MYGLKLGNNYKVFSKVEDIAHMDVICADETSTIEDALEIMANNNIRDVVYYNTTDECYNIFMARDLFSFIRCETDYSIQLKDITTRKLCCFKHDDNILEIYPDIHLGDEYFGVLNDKNELSGILSYTDITTSIDPNILVENKSVGEVLSSSPVITVSPDTSALDAFFHLNHVDAAVIICESENILGILTTKDMINIIRRKSDTSLSVKTYMTSPVQTVHMDSSIKEVLQYIGQKGFKRAIVVDHDGNLIGAVTQRDLAGYAYSHWAELMRAHADELHELVDMLEDKALSFEHAALTDPLTGIANRKSFNDGIESELSRFYRYKTGAFSLLMLDIDHFKNVNDQHGHLIGDEVLIDLVKVVNRLIRDTDTFARWGGEEFTILLPLTALEQAKLLAERIRVAISEHSFQLDEGITVSIGVGQYLEGESVQEFIQRVDAALYSAKDSGRNRVSVAL
jgi:diguanylate cyclase (GGDEF)-like protein